MEYRQIGTSGTNASAIGLGALKDPVGKAIAGRPVVTFTPAGAREPQQARKNAARELGQMHPTRIA
jgi:hypothetical protein